jgi:hypothetical protein
VAGHPFDPASIPHGIENRGVATRIDEERNPQVSGAFRRPPQITESARLNLSRWRHGFEPRWDYQRNPRLEGRYPPLESDGSPLGQERAKSEMAWAIERPVSSYRLTYTWSAILTDV